MTQLADESITKAQVSQGHVTTLPQQGPVLLILEVSDVNEKKLLAPASPYITEH